MSSPHARRDSFRSQIDCVGQFVHLFFGSMLHHTAAVLTQPLRIQCCGSPLNRREELLDAEGFCRNGSHSKKAALSRSSFVTSNPLIAMIFTLGLIFCIVRTVDGPSEYGISRSISTTSIIVLCCMYSRVLQFHLWRKKRISCVSQRYGNGDR